ncbi:MAG: iron uptake porin [Jaaginema sp. PMC 1079.18]|nr:iron uptake porin [Jaaginema sp. PMC 1080.18]MEC4853040.1 iron uptake porin [Jaaginema sp. PMC 1079.18]MEC4865641.1 iron uptake porin [Jaaginema sp. PMC 1078.18]
MLHTQKCRFLEPRSWGLLLSLSTVLAIPQAVFSQTPAIDLDSNTLPESENWQGTLDQSLPSSSQFRDITPDVWAFSALQSLIERYDCLQGYPNGTFRGDRPLTRYEFAAGLNACLSQIERLIAATNSDAVSRDDLRIIEQLRNEFQTELDLLRRRTNDLESRIAFLENNAFSITTKFNGEAIFALSDTIGPNFVQSSSNLSFLPGVSIDLPPQLIQQAAALGLDGAPRVDAFVDNDNNTVFGARGRLDLITSFTGYDRLWLRLSETNITPFTANSRGIFRAPAFPPFIPNPINARFTRNTGEATQTFNLPDSKLGYFFPLGNTQVYIPAAGGKWNDLTPTLNPYFFDQDGGHGALSTFASESPIYRIGGGAGIVFDIPLWQPLRLTLGYLAGPGVVDPDYGLFNGEYSALGQFTVDMGSFDWGLTYVHAYHRAENAIFDRGRGRNGFVGTIAANFPGSLLQNLARPILGLEPTPTVTNSYGIQAAWQVNEKVSISGFFAYTDAILLQQGDSEIWTYGAGVALPDLGKPGNLLGVFFGAQPYAGQIKIPRAIYRNNVVPYHFEAFYRHHINPYISISPGFIWLWSANEINRSVFVPTIRTTFSF